MTHTTSQTAGPHRHHTLDYVEIDVTDLAEAQAFYGGAFGWRFTTYGPGYAGIRGADGAAEVGGLNLADSVGPRGVLVLLVSDDLDATARAIEAAGGRVVQGPYDFPGGRRLHFTDPSGNELGVWSAT